MDAVEDVLDTVRQPGYGLAYRRQALRVQDLRVQHGDLDRNGGLSCNRFAKQPVVFVKTTTAQFVEDLNGPPQAIRGCQSNTQNGLRPETTGVVYLLTKPRVPSNIIDDRRLS